MPWLRKRLLGQWTGPTGIVLMTRGSDRTCLPLVSAVTVVVAVVGREFDTTMSQQHSQEVVFDFT